MARWFRLRKYQQPINPKLNKPEHKRMNNSEQKFDEGMKKVMAETANLDKEVLYLMLVKLGNAAAFAEDTDKTNTSDPTELLKTINKRTEAHILAVFYAARFEITGKPSPC